jgi:hypothetical protein
MKGLVVIICLLFSFNAFSSDSIIVRKDARLDILLSKQALINKNGTYLTHNNKGPGYRLQVVSTNNRQEAYSIKGKLLQIFPDQKSYAFFQSPYFKVRMGNFVDKAEADQFKKRVEAILKRPVYVVRDIVEISLSPDELLLEE